MTIKRPEELARDRLAKAQSLSSIINSLAYQETLGSFISEAQKATKHEICAAKKVIDLVRLQGRLTMLQELNDYIDGVLNSGIKAQDVISKTLLK